MDSSATFNFNKETKVLLSFTAQELLDELAFYSTSLKKRNYFAENMFTVVECGASENYLQYQYGTFKKIMFSILHSLFCVFLKKILFAK